MNITLRDHKLFDIPKGLLIDIRSEWYRPTCGCMEVAEKVGRIALVIFLLPFAFIADLAVSLAVLVSRVCCPPAQRFRPAPLFPLPGGDPPPAPHFVAPRPRAQPQVAEPAPAPVEAIEPMFGNLFDEPVAQLPIPVQDGGVPSQALIDVVLRRPQPDVHYPIQHKIFLWHAIHHALQFHTPESRAEYKTWINDGIAGDNENGEPRVDIHKWITECLLAYCLTIMPNPLPPEIEGAAALFNPLSRPNKAAALLDLMVPEKNWWQVDTGWLLNDVRRQALALNQNQNYLQQVMAPLIGNNIDNLPNP